MLTIKAKRSRNSRRYITKLGSENSNSAAKSQDTAHLETERGKGPRQCVRVLGKTSKKALWGSPLNPRMLSVIISNL